MSSHSFILNGVSVWGPFAKSNYNGNIGSCPVTLAAQLGITLQSSPTYGCGGVGGSGSGLAAGYIQTNTWNGMLTMSNHNFWNYCSSIKDVTDGTSNTAFVGEVTVSLNANPHVPSTLSSEVFPGWAGGVGQSPSGLTDLTALGGNEGDECPGAGLSVGNMFRYMDAGYPINSPPSVTIATSDLSFGSWHTGGANFLFADGSVHFISAGIDGNTYQGLGTRPAANC